MIISQAATILASSALTLISAHRAVGSIQAAYACRNLAGTMLRTKGVVGNIFVALSLLVAAYSAVRVMYITAKRVWTNEPPPSSELDEITKRTYVAVAVGAAAAIGYYALLNGTNLPNAWNLA